MRDLAREYSAEAIEKCVHLMRNGSTQSVQLIAAAMILDRAWGKPKQAVDIETTGKTLEQLLEAVYAARQAEKAANAETIDAAEETVLNTTTP